MDFKVKHVRRFLEGGNKVRLAVVFRGREITHPQTGMKVLNRVVELCNDIATVEATPNMEGRRMIMVIAPKPNVVRKAAEAKRAAANAQIAALAQKKDQPGSKRPPPELDDDDLDEDEINADVDDDDDADDDLPPEGPAAEIAVAAAPPTPPPPPAPEVAKAKAKA
jgi:translation initiation factor IF-3